MKRSETLLERRRRLMGPAYTLFYDRPLHLVRGEGVWLSDIDGRRYLDCYNNVAHVGHCHPHVVEAIARQAGKLNTHTRYLHEGVLDLGERLIRRCRPGLDTVMYGCSGTEANELALRMARIVTGASGIIVTECAYHGTSWAIAQISTEDCPPEHRGDHVETIPSPDALRGPFHGDDAADRFAAHIDQAIEALAARGHRPAALILDTVMSSEGVPALPPGCLAAAAGSIRKAGGLFVADEVQGGYGRTGAHFWGHEADDFTPDFITAGKPMGNGHPVSAVIARRELAERFSDTFHYFNTFGGNPVSAAAALAVLEVMEREDLQRNAADTGHYLRGLLGKLAERHEAVADVRGPGLFIAVELARDPDSLEPDPALARRVMNGLCERGVLIGVTGPHENVLKIRPPLVFGGEHAELLAERLDEVLTSEERTGPR